MKCENCGTTPSHPSEVRLWKQIRVGHVESPERFHLCPSCDDDPSVEPIDVWANIAETHQVTVRA